jgi:DNA-binding transcriptional LysR family regulator
VSDAEALKQTGKELHAGLIGQLRVGLSSAPGVLLSVPLMLHMAQHHPRLHLEISRGNTAVLLATLRDQKLDAAIVDTRSMRPSSDLEVTHAFELEAGFLARPDHPLAHSRTRRDAGRVDGLPHCLHPAERRGGAHPDRPATAPRPTPTTW